MTQANKRRLFQLVLLGFMFAIFEVGSCVALKVVPQFRGHAMTKSEFFALQKASIKRTLDGTTEALVVFDGELGWTHGPNTSRPGRKVSAQATRGARSYTATAADGVVRMATFGDSFTYGEEVDDGKDWGALLEKRGNQVEVMNYGVSGYGPGQAYLRFKRRGPESKAQVMMFGLSVWDLPRSMSVSPRFFAPEADFAVKPRYIYKGPGQLELIPSPIKEKKDLQKYYDEPKAILEVGKQHDHFYEKAIFENPLFDYSHTVRLFSVSWVIAKRRMLDPDREFVGARGARIFNTEGAAYHLALELSQRFDQDVKALGAKPIIVIFPDIKNVERMYKNEPGMADQWLKDCLAAGLDCRNATEAFKDYKGDLEPLFMPAGHYSEAGGELVADWFNAVLKDLRK